MEVCGCSRLWLIVLCFRFECLLCWFGMIYLMLGLRVCYLAGFVMLSLLYSGVAGLYLHWFLLFLGWWFTCVCLWFDCLFVVGVWFGCLDWLLSWLFSLYVGVSFILAVGFAVCGCLRLTVLLR